MNRIENIKKIILNNLYVIGLVWKSSKIWVVLNMIDIIINPLRNLTIDVLLIGIIYNAIGETRNFHALFPVFFGILIFYLLNISFEAVLIGYINPIENLKIRKSIDKILMEKAAETPLSAYDDSRYYQEYIFSVQNCMETAKNAVMNLASFIAYFLGGLMSIGLIVSIEPVMIGFIVISMIYSSIIAIKRNKEDIDYSTNMSPIHVKEQFIHRAFYLKDYTKELRCFNLLPNLMFQKFITVEKENIHISKKYGRKFLKYSTLQTFSQRIVMYWLIMFLIIIIIFYKGAIEPGNILIMTTSIGTAALLIGAIFNTIPSIGKVSLFKDKLDHFMQRAQQEQISEAYNNPYMNMVSSIDSICFESVTFYYPGESRPALSNISFEVKKGERLAIVGLNGAGKTTIMKLLLNFYQPDSGAIYVNGIDIKQIPVSTYRKMFGVIYQDFNLYALSLQDNITLSNDNTDSERLKKVVYQSGLSFLAREDKTMNSQMTKEFYEDGMVLSGGERQKLAIARAIYGDTSVLLFDEITSSIDPETEFEIMQTIVKASEDKITLIISHKLSCVKDVSKIIYLEEGSIKETGTHQELIQLHEKYYTLFKQQADKFVQEETLKRREEWQ